MGKVAEITNRPDTSLNKSGMDMGVAVTDSNSDMTIYRNVLEKDANDQDYRPL